MIKQLLPVPINELERIFSLSEFDIDYSDVSNNFKDLTRLAAKIADMDVSLVNLIDTFNQWTISNHGLDISHMPREDSVCQYTITEDNYFEVADLAADNRFKEKSYVSGPPNLRYYFGLPLTTTEGFNIGALCILDKTLRKLKPEKIEMLKIVADEVVHRLQTLKAIDVLKNQLTRSAETQRKVAHDIRGPIAGIIGLSEIIEQQPIPPEIDEVLECARLINKSGRSVMDLAEEILSEDLPEPPNKEVFTLSVFKHRIENLYLPQARSKQITFTVNINEQTAHVPVLKNKLLQITGNLISNALKFTPVNGNVSVDLDLLPTADGNRIKIKVIDSGVGLDKATIDTISKGNTESSTGTSGEKGYGFGLLLVKHLVESLNGQFSAYNNQDKGATFEVSLIQNRV